MNIEDRLRKLKTITPRSEYTERSRSFILSTIPDPVQTRLTVWQFVMQNVQLGSAMALTGLLLLIGFGGFSAWKFLSPFGLSSLDPANLRAEAEVVNDIGVALNSIQYIPPVQDSSALAKIMTPPSTSRSAALVAPKNASTSAPADGPSLMALTEDQTTTSTESSGTSSTDERYDFSTTTVDTVLDLLLE